MHLEDCHFFSPAKANDNAIYGSKSPNSNWVGNQAEAIDWEQLATSFLEPLDCLSSPISSGSEAATPTWPQIPSDSSEYSNEDFLDNGCRLPSVGTAFPFSRSFTGFQDQQSFPEYQQLLQSEVQLVDEFDLSLIRGDPTTLAHQEAVDEGYLVDAQQGGYEQRNAVGHFVGSQQSSLGGVGVDPEDEGWNPRNQVVLPRLLLEDERGVERTENGFSSGE